ncbi:endonuclease/exonuclease/phosphatase family protein [Aerococcaceae bacterium NML190073]|nr:endonuclease/exonuclease/phosphatase family protein [Aerococcaceae bacterium NML190073]
MKIRIITANMENHYLLPENLRKKKYYNKYTKEEKTQHYWYTLQRDSEVRDNNDFIVKSLLSEEKPFDILVLTELQTQESDRLENIFKEKGYQYIRPVEKVPGRQLTTALIIKNDIIKLLKLSDGKTTTLLQEKPMHLRNCTFENSFFSFSAFYPFPTSENKYRNAIREREMCKLFEVMKKNFESNDKTYFYIGDFNIDFMTDDEKSNESNKKISSIAKKLPDSVNSWNFISENSLEYKYSHKKFKTKLDYIFTNAPFVSVDNSPKPYDTDHIFHIAEVEVEI